MVVPSYELSNLSSLAVHTPSIPLPHRGQGNGERDGYNEGMKGMYNGISGSHFRSFEPTWRQITLSRNGGEDS